MCRFTVYICSSHLFFCYMQVVWIKQSPCGSVDLSDLESKLKVRAWLFRVYLLNTYLHGHWWSVGSSTNLCQFFLCWFNCVIVFHFILAVLNSWCFLGAPVLFWLHSLLSTLGIPEQCLSGIGAPWFPECVRNPLPFYIQSVHVLLLLLLSACSFKN